MSQIRTRALDELAHHSDGAGILRHAISPRKPPMHTASKRRGTDSMLTTTSSAREIIAVGREGGTAAACGDSIQPLPAPISTSGDLTRYPFPGNDRRPTGPGSGVAATGDRAFGA